MYFDLSYKGLNLEFFIWFMNSPTNTNFVYGDCLVFRSFSYGLDMFDAGFLVLWGVLDLRWIRRFLLVFPIILMFVCLFCADWHWVRQIRLQITYHITNGFITNPTGRIYPVAFTCNNIILIIIINKNIPVNKKRDMAKDLLDRI